MAILISLKNGLNNTDLYLPPSAIIKVTDKITFVTVTDLDGNDWDLPMTINDFKALYTAST